MLTKIEKHLKFIYKDKYQESFTNDFLKLINQYEPQKVTSIDQTKSYLITYGDSFYDAEKPTLEVLYDFVNEKVGNTISDIHILPMFPYTSDDGFSVVDYMRIDENLGDWSHVKRLSHKYGLMFDFVANHISQESEWFKGYLNNEETYKNFFTEKSESFNYDNVVRPRALPLFYEYENGQSVWATFSKDQIDLNFREIKVLLKTTEILLEYGKRGATSIRLDAIGFIWKESGTPCIHLPEAHEIIKLWRTILDEKFNNLQIITETNVPHLENISYFGNDDNEAHQVYNFALPTLVLHSFVASNSKCITKWLSSLEKISNKATYFNFLSSHDGIGMRSSEGILTDGQREDIFSHVKTNGALFNYNSNPDGSQTVYEINITYFDAIKHGHNEDDDIQRFLTAHAILCSILGVPAIYYNSLIGSINDSQAAEESGINRRINREKFDVNEILVELESNPRRKSVFSELQKY